MSGTVTGGAGTSAAPGALLPAGGPAYDDALADALTGYTASVTGLASPLVRPRWQAVPPPEPPLTATWCGLGVLVIRPDANAYVGHDGAGNGSDSFIRHETLMVMASFYGPAAQTTAAQFRDSFEVWQNIAQLESLGFGFVGCGEIRSLPDLVNAQYRRRYDVEFTLRREVDRTYPVLNILLAKATTQVSP